MRIRVISTPQGEAPENVRQALVGLELEVVPSSIGLTIGCLGGSAVTIRGYKVISDHVIKALKQKDEQSSRWFEKFCAQASITYFVFGSGACSVISTENS